jgi:type IV secretion system pilin
MRRIIQKLKLASFTALFAVVGLLSIAFAQPTYAAALNHCPVTAADCVAAASSNCASINKCDLVTNYINPFVNFLAILVGIGVVTSIIIGGIQYSSSAGEPAKATAAKNRIRDAIIALVVFVLLYGMLNFLIPGGLV